MLTVVTFRCCPQNQRYSTRYSEIWCQYSVKLHHHHCSVLLVRLPFYLSRENYYFFLFYWMRLTLLFYFDGFIPVHCRLYFLRAWVSEMNYYWAWLVYTTSRHHEAFLSLFDLISHLFPRMTDPFFKGLTQDHIFLTAEVEKVTNTVNLYLCCNPLRLLTPRGLAG